MSGSRRARALRSVAMVQLRSLSTDAVTILSLGLQPLFLALLAFYMLRVNDPAAGAYALVGSGLTGLWSATLLHSMLAILSERYNGNLEMLAAIPRSMTLIMSGKLFTDLSVSLVTISAAYALTASLAGWPFSVAAPGWFLAACLICGVTFLACGVVFTALGLLRPDLHHWLPLLGYPIPILSGFLFPIEILPGSVSVIAQALPTHWAARLAHLTSSSEQGPRPLDWIMGIGMVALLGAAASFAMNRAGIRARRNGSLSAF